MGSKYKQGGNLRREHTMFKYRTIVLGNAYKYCRYSLEFIGCGVEQGIDYNSSG